MLRLPYAFVLVPVENPVAGLGRVGGRGAGRKDPGEGVQARGDGDRLGACLEVTLAGLADGLLVGARDGEKPNRTRSVLTGALAWSGL